MDTNYIYHITTASAWAKAQDAGEYVAESLAIEGFIHCSAEAQVDGVIDRYYKGQTKNLVKLTIDKSKVVHPLIYELAGSINEVFPHIHGPINLSAIVSVDSL